jgi:Flp pilus assembly protein CpaB
MRWTIVGLVLVGIIAATAAAILVVTLKAGGPMNRTSEDVGNQPIRILVATRDVPAQTVVDGSAIATREVKRREAPQDYLSDPVQAVGQVLIQPVKFDEAFAKSKFASGENAVKIAPSLETGQRAMSIMLSDDTGIEQLLYPGCLVDVIGSFRVPRSEDQKGDEILSVTLLQGIPVLAVGPRTIVSSTEGATPQAGGASDQIGRRGRVVALNVTTKQAEVLQLASKYGAVTVSLRNPLDTAVAETGGTFIGEFFKDLEPKLAELSAPAESVAPLSAPDIASIVSGAGASGGGGGGGTTSTQAMTPTLAAPKRGPLYHTTTIIRGARNIETQKFPIGPAPAGNEE